MKTLKVIAALLDYPDAEIQAHADELVAVIQSDTRLPEDQRREIADFALRLARTDLMEAQADYIETFDRGRSLSLSLFEHVHGESRDRGQAMVDLLRVYEEAGFSISVRELPDYLPLFLEFLSTRTQEDAVHWLAEVAHILQLLYTRLEAREKPFARLFRPLLYLAGEEASTAALEEQIGAEARDDTPEALDKAWAEEPVTFGMPGGKGCGSAQAGKAVPIHWDRRRADGSLGNGL